jgi:hypothetical protein
MWSNGIKNTSAEVGRKRYKLGCPHTNAAAPHAVLLLLLLPHLLLLLKLTQKELRHV